MWWRLWWVGPACALALVGTSLTLMPRAAPVETKVATRSFFSSQPGRYPPVEPTSPHTKDVVFTLIMGGPDYRDYEIFLESIKCIRKSVAPGAHVDFIGFHEGNVQPKMQKRLADELAAEDERVKLRFFDVRLYGGFVLPPRTPPIRYDGPHTRSGYELKHLGYRHMCRFMALLWFRALAKYEYAMRVDEDVCVYRGHTTGDLFKQLRAERAVYGYGAEVDELHMMTKFSLTPWLQDYAFNFSISPQRPPLDAFTIYFTNFFITKAPRPGRPRLARARRADCARASVSRRSTGG
jgi:hypothetical protein